MCVKETVAQWEQSPFLSRYAGYDHVILYGYEYPHWRRLSHLTLDYYSPFFSNMLVITVSFWSQDRRAATQSGGFYGFLRMVVVPYFAAWDCSTEASLLQA